MTVILNSMGQRVSLSNARTGGQLLYAVGIFVLVGIGLGLIGFVALTQLAGGNNMTDAIFSGIFFIIILVIALFFGPVIAAIVGIQMGNRNQSSSVYLTSLIGNMIGYIVMMLIVLAILSVGIGLVSNGGGSGTMGGTSGEMGASGGGGFGQWIFPIIAISMITGVTGAGASYLQVQTSPRGVNGTENFPKAIPTKWIIVVFLIGVVLLGGVYGSSVLLSGNPASDLEVNGDAYSQGDSLYGDALIENVGDNEATATLAIRFLIDGQESDDLTSSTEVTVSSGETTTETLEVGQFSDLSQSELDDVDSGNWTMEFLINDEVKDTVTA